MKIGSIEKQKLDLHLASLRELERQIQATPTVPPGAACTKNVDFKGLQDPDRDALNYYQDDNNFAAVGDGGMDVEYASYNHVLVTILQAMGLNDTTFGNPDYGRGPIPGLLS